MTRLPLVVLACWVASCSPLSDKPESYIEVPGMSMMVDAGGELTVTYEYDKCLVGNGEKQAVVMKQKIKAPKSAAMSVLEGLFDLLKILF